MQGYLFSAPRPAEEIEQLYFAGRMLEVDEPAAEAERSVA
jgi:hypothetical protein